MKPRRIAMLSGAAFAAVIAIAAFAAPGKVDPDAPANTTVEDLLNIRYELLRAKPLLDRLEKLDKLIDDLHETSPALEQLEDLEVKAGSVARIEKALERIEKLQPTLAALEEAQRASTAPARPGLPARGPVKWNQPTDKLLERVEEIEKRVYAPSSLREPAGMRDPIEIRILQLEKRQESLARELETTQKDLQRLRREQRNQGY